MLSHVPGGAQSGAAPTSPRVFIAHLPETFDPSVTKPAWEAYACWVVSAVVFRRYVDQDADENTFVPLHHKYVEGHIPKKVRKPLLDDLVKGGVLECDGTFYFGQKDGRKNGRHLPGPPGKSYCYRLGEAH